MRLFRLLVATLCLAALTLGAAPAHAAGTLTVSNILWKDRPNESLMSNTLNRADCLADVKATVTAAVRGVPASGVTFEIWSGTGCDQQVNRASTSTSRTCSKVRTVGTPVDQTIEIAFRDLIKPYGDDDPATEAVCDQSLATGLISRTLYYIVIDSSFNSVITTTPSWSFKYDIKGPPPPTAVTASPGDETIVTSFTAPVNEPNLYRYRFYCSPKSSSPVDVGGSTSTDETDADVGGSTGEGGASTAGTSGTAGTGGSAVVVDPNCQSATLIPGEEVPAGMEDCGSVPATGAKGGETDPSLVNGEEFVIAVAAEDTVNNVGVLSNLACATPKDVRGFFENYRDAGGEAGGGYCSFAPARRSGTALLLALGAGALVLRRRRS